MVITKNPILEIIEFTATDEAEVRHVLLSFERVCAVALTAPAELQPHRSHMPTGQRALTEPVPTGSKDSP
jgi:hypothetical protein